MSKAVAINGSPRMERGNTAMVLSPFIEGMMDAGSQVELFYASRLKVKPCACGNMYCWTQMPAIVLVSTSGWWEKGNFGTVVRVVKELAEDVSVKFAGAVLRPHVDFMKRGGELTQDGRAVLNAVRRAGYELVKDGVMKQETLATISRPLISRAGFWRYMEA